MHRRKFLKLLGLAPVLAVVAAKVGLPDPEPSEEPEWSLEEVDAADFSWTTTSNSTTTIYVDAKPDPDNYRYSTGGYYFRPLEEGIHPAGEQRRYEIVGRTDA